MVIPGVTEVDVASTTMALSPDSKEQPEGLSLVYLAPTGHRMRNFVRWISEAGVIVGALYIIAQSDNIWLSCAFTSFRGSDATATIAASRSSLISMLVPSSHPSLSHIA